MTQDPNTEILLRLIEMAEKATLGEWRSTEEDSDMPPDCWDWYVQAVCGDAWDNIASCGGAAYEDGWKYTREQRKANSEFIAAARNAIPALQSLLNKPEAEAVSEPRDQLAVELKAYREWQASLARRLQELQTPPLPSDKLRGLVRKWRKEAWHGPGEAQYRMGRGHSADELEALLSQEPSSGEDAK